jgi:hypothetical protein
MVNLKEKNQIIIKGKKKELKSDTGHEIGITV